MKKYSIFLMAIATFAFASCGDNKSTEGDTTNQAQMDSVAKATEAQVAAAQQAKNDSLIQAEAKHVADSTHMADSMAAAEKAAADKKGTKHTTPKTPKVSTTKTTTPTPPPAPVKTAQDQKFDNMKDHSKDISDQKKKEQDDKFSKMK
jgi:hypothetical protein